MQEKMRGYVCIINKLFLLIKQANNKSNFLKII